MKTINPIETARQQLWDKLNEKHTQLNFAFFLKTGVLQELQDQIDLLVLYLEIFDPDFEWDEFYQIWKQIEIYEKDFDQHE